KIYNFNHTTNVHKNDMKTIIQTINQIIKKKTLEEMAAIFSDKEACVSAVLTFEEALNHPQFNERDMFTSLDQSGTSFNTQLGIPIKLSKTAGAIKTAAPKLGEHTGDILKTF